MLLDEKKTSGLGGAAAAQQQQQQQQHGIVSLHVPSSNNDDGARWRMHAPRTGSRSLYTVQVGSCGTCGGQQGEGIGKSCRGGSTPGLSDQLQLS